MSTHVLQEGTIRVLLRSGYSAPASSANTISITTPLVSEQFLVDPRFAVVVDDSVRTIVGSNVRTDIALALHKAVCAASHAVPEIVPTQDGGLTLEYTDDKTARQIAFAIPADGSVRYFVARGPGRFREAGVVTDDGAVPGLARWVSDESAPFPRRGLELG